MVAVPPVSYTHLAAARTWARGFFAWYNNQHYHSGLNLMTPKSVHFGEAEAVQQHWQRVMADAFQVHPARFRVGLPVANGAPTAVYINPPKTRKNLA